MQLILLHLRRYHVFLIFWWLLFATINGQFLYKFGAHRLYLYPEYLGEVNALSTAFVGAAFAIFFMCWNITTFILHSRQVRFLATATQPLLKYSVNNFGLPLILLFVYVVQGWHYASRQELLPGITIVWLAGGFAVGFVLTVLVGFTYFFGADRTIYRQLAPGEKAALHRHKLSRRSGHGGQQGIMRVDWYLEPNLKPRQPRNISHYTPELLDRIFKQHHLAAVISIMLAFGSLVVLGYFLDTPIFQLPAAASITVAFAILIAVAGAVSYFLGKWSLLFVGFLLLLFNFFYQQKILDPRNKAYGLNYTTESSFPPYNRKGLLQGATPAMCTADSLQYIALLNAWKARQTEDKPVLVLLACSGGGWRAATLTLHVLHRLDSVSGKHLMQRSFLVSGASGGMIGAAWYRELAWRRHCGQITDAQVRYHLHDVSKDLLNPVFSSLVARDVLAPPRRFTYGGQQYLKDRGYAFEYRLNENTHSWLDRTLLQCRALEDTAAVPRLMPHCVVTRDGRKVLIATRPARFMLRPQLNAAVSRPADPDAIDFVSYFDKQQSVNLRMLSALRMNATFPYVLPNVWLPTNPVVDVMDAGFRDNTGLETATRFLYVFRQWIEQNCKTALLVQIRDKEEGGWSDYEESNSIFDLATRPALLTQSNLFRFQEYVQLRQVEWLQQLMGPVFHRVIFNYKPSRRDAAAAINFHITQREKMDIAAALKNEENNRNFMEVMTLLK
jgi:hypothetical protein